MASERAPHPDKRLTGIDALHPPESDEPFTVSAEDIAHTVERLEVGRESGEYTSMRESDLIVLWKVGQLGQDQLDAVKRDPSLLPRVLTPTAHA